MNTELMRKTIAGMQGFLNRGTMCTCLRPPLAQHLRLQITDGAKQLMQYNCNSNSVKLSHKDGNEKHTYTDYK
eukprot:1274757-Amphidinium_carterae.1